MLNSKNFSTFLTLVFWLNISSFILPHLTEARGGKRVLTGNLKSGVGLLLDEVAGLHKALLSKDGNDAVVAIKKVKNRIKELEKIFDEDGVSKISHMHHLIFEIKREISLALEFTDSNRRKVLRSVFRDISQIVLDYKFSKYRVYYCIEDQIYWVQKKGRRMKNPFGKTNYSSCLRAS